MRIKSYKIVLCNFHQKKFSGGRECQLGFTTADSEAEISYKDYCPDFNLRLYAMKYNTGTAMRLMSSDAISPAMSEMARP